MDSENTHSGNLESNTHLVQKIKFAIDLEQLRNVVNKSSGDYFELTVGVATRSEFVAVVYSNSKDAQVARIVAFGKAYPPSTKCLPTN
jgi:uncharacterized protein (DUF4213/DUF364 family)